MNLQIALVTQEDGHACCPSALPDRDRPPCGRGVLRDDPRCRDAAARSDGAARRPSPVPAAWEAELRRVIELDPHTVSVASANWTTRLLARYLGEQTGYHASLETVRVHLHQAGYVCKRPTWTLQRRAEEGPGWAKNA